MEPELGSTWRSLKLGLCYKIVFTMSEALAMRCKSGELVYLWGWEDDRGSFKMIAPVLPQLMPNARIFQKLPMTAEFGTTSNRYARVVVYQSQDDNRLWVGFADEFVNGKIKVN